MLYSGYVYYNVTPSPSKEMSYVEFKKNLFKPWAVTPFRIDNKQT